MPDQPDKSGEREALIMDASINDTLTLRWKNILIFLRIYRALFMLVFQSQWCLINLGVVDFSVNSSPPGQNGCHFGKRRFQMHFLESK